MVRPGLRALSTVVALATVAPGPGAARSPAAPDAAPAVPDAAAATAPLRTPLAPQVKIDRVDASDPSAPRFYLSALDEGGQPAPVAEQGLQVFLAEGKGPVRTSGAEPVARFGADGMAAKGFRGSLKEVPKADVAQAVVLVAMLHADTPREVAAVLPDLAAAVLDGLRPDARAALVTGNDAVLASWDPAGDAPSFTDVNDFQDCLGDLREASGQDPAPGGGTGCGRLFASPAPLATLVQALPAPQGLFPRLLGPEEGGDLMAWAAAHGHARIDRQEESYVRERFAAGGVEAALRLLAAGSPPGALRSVVVLSDGRDGYLRVADAAGDAAAPRCRNEAKACSGAAGQAPAGLDPEGASKPCSRAVLECAVPRVSEVLARREGRAREQLTELVLLARALEVRISTVALPGTDAVGAARLQALAVRTGGSFRALQAPAGVKAAGKALALELSRQAVVRPSLALEAGKEYTAVAVAGEQRSAPYRFTAGEGAPRAPGLLDRGRAMAIRKLGHSWGPPAFWAVAVLAALAALGLALALGKGVLALVKKVAAPKVPKKPAAPRMPTLKRPT